MAGDASSVDPVRKPRIQKIFAANLRAIRAEKGLTQQRLAELADLHVVFVSQLERGVKSVSLDNLQTIASALGCNAYELLMPASKK